MDKLTVGDMKRAVSEVTGLPPQYQKYLTPLDSKAVLEQDGRLLRDLLPAGSMGAMFTLVTTAEQNVDVPMTIRVRTKGGELVEVETECCVAQPTNHSLLSVCLSQPSLAAQ